ncbi:hypothetical protein CDQ84_08460 [Clostridium thermosuccinogenes]|uniref:HTH araC/xylS-type domain-containing protein n=1 Tax=Clostridium thermosuccinogenes TaxID=84032 RepID=A0A2K2F4X6_9CLOT|nr:AraC family transcriptional regulator [Pseudoclostridium thermosuccinogenes]AUS97590.1 hypothetical protein CDO33_14755 [Pseudoclostridium thermosuccinogenes]PNT93843.1 hypothetical protein CDQ83_10255 [Pseudoclostridium thermosuccinogenes]PNT97454.1 hypothetical protein CDQ85_08305 [Pseudoclostridium thermosuccinogenes]PNT99486.1 hypothetical protein CDQ84_08460 [Pseudoclostridium thermosuccinogenes]
MSNDNIFFKSRPLPDEEFLPTMSLFECPQMYITISNKNFSFASKGSHAHDGYEFIISNSYMPHLGVDSKSFCCSKNEILAINPGQQHGPLDRIDNAYFHGAMVSRKLMEETAYSIYGKSNVQFKNEVSAASSLLRNLMGMFVSEAKMPQAGTSIILTSLSCHIAALLLRELKSNMPCTEKLINSIEARRIKGVIDYMNESYNIDCSIEDLSSVAGLSSYHFIRVFKNNTGKTPYEYLIDLRIEKAKQLLADKNYTVTDVCLECGFNNPSHFTRLFKNKTGITPTYFRSIILK